MFNLFRISFHVTCLYIITQDNPGWAWTVNDYTTIAFMLLAWTYASVQTHRRQQINSSQVVLNESLLEHERSTYEDTSVSSFFSNDDINDDGGTEEEIKTLPIASPTIENGDDEEVETVALLFESTMIRVRHGSIAAIVMFSVLGLFLGFAFWLATSYPYFLFFTK